MKSSPKNTSKSTRSKAPDHDPKVTLGMVAEACGVSPSTVSRILNGTAVVSAEKRAAVDQAIAELGFVPNPMARGLAGGRTLSVGVITQAIDSPFYGIALRGIEEALNKVGYSPLFVSGHWNAKEEARCIEVLRSRRVDGFIVLTGRLSDESLKTLAKALPVVVTGRSLAAPGLYALDFNNFEGARLATEHLLALGHRDIAFIAGPVIHPDALERLRGYRSALQAAGLRYRPGLVVQGQYHEESGLLAVEQLIASRQPFSAIFAANDQMAFGATLALHRHGLHVPDEVSLVGFDDVAGAAHSVPPLTTIHHPAYELGSMAAAALLQLLAGEQPQATLPDPRLTVRGSTRALLSL
ncbi:LacI family DNA-binding transcriptional regulator [Roseateles sp.]|uniref:LacI family DNA-binding transcriptional regulator n=1 Tax=Roseateles sp. TaxID=1971397 RepID=UPI00286A8269|nr:LacI family DNA-binding transcriptional regulator [Roseateles sp.]